ncbi:alpha-ketoglutarate-dependent dioxygenase AlkB [Galbibacter sp. EGI 63066]|uniref:alpha-ketoglutarate-dependent dioxygenase AlkB family protein n=1 Tax=Galbibacter sp. EGI 63066 TaxID=2993559 RepID=UPI002249466E|nr:alpha-ketoglutarate-dependent dioxygenase AlkB [Galbibacter sp. EGI 63066]MCX2680113.1 alpha-ketoglutarate-dependent dioxygenase AlkB [Galbibacter sp. EGI 63066]
MKLFDIHTDPNQNLLPYDGIVNYYGNVIPHVKASDLYDSLLNSITWEHDKIILFGKQIVTKRKVAWYGDKPFTYTYSNITKQALEWTKELMELKQLIEEKTGETYNSCLLNLYHNGSEGMSWHSDDEKELQKNGAIASLSLGAERKFVFKHKKTKEKVAVTLENGSLILMKGITQTHWLHSLPPTKKVNSPRINLTFRTIVS